MALWPFIDSRSRRRRYRSYPDGAVEWDRRAMSLIRGYELTFGDNEACFATAQYFYC